MTLAAIVQKQASGLEGLGGWTEEVHEIGGRMRDALANVVKGVHCSCGVPMFAAEAALDYHARITGVRA